MSNSSEIPIPIASGSTNQTNSSCSKISTSVQMSDGTCLPLSFRNSAFSRFPFTAHSSSSSHNGPQSVEMSSSPFQPSSQSKPSAAFSFSLEAGFSLSPAGFHPASFTGPGSFGASHLARMESAFCQNFVCCAIPLRDLHDLLEHFEQAHCHAGDIVGVDGFEGVTLDQMAAGVGLSAELGLGPGTAPQNNNSDPNPSRRRRRPPSVSVSSRAAPASHTLHELRFEDEEEWSSGHDTSRSGSPAHLNRSPLQSHSDLRNGSEVEEDTMTRLGKTLRETLGTLRPNPITIDRSRNSSNSRSRSGSLSESHDDKGTAADRALSDLIASFRSKARGNRHDPLQGSRHSRHENGNTNGFFGRIGVAPSELDGRNHRMEGGAIDPAVLLENHPFEGADGSTDPFGDDIPHHLQLDPEQLLKHQQQQRRRRRPNVDPVTGLTPTGRLPRPWTPVSEKPFKCSVPGCEKAYKQQNGLKYHKTHGHSSQAILTADEESKAFICHDIVCGKRYKNMNGLRYHYQHTGPHGALGIQLLSLGVHPPPQYPPGHKKSSMINSSSNPSFCPASSGSSPPSF